MLSGLLKICFGGVEGPPTVRVSSLADPFTAYAIGWVALTLGITLADGSRNGSRSQDTRLKVNAKPVCTGNAVLNDG